MKRRQFLSAAGIATAGSVMSATTLEAQSSNREFYELRQYRMRPGSYKNKMNTFIETVALPAWNRAGISPVGVFTPFIGPDSLNLFVLLPHKNLDSMLSLPNKLQNDKTYQADGADFLSVSQNDPGYTRMHSSLLFAFPKFPKIQARVRCFKKRCQNF